MTSILEGQPSEKRPFPTKTSVMWIPGVCICIISLLGVVFGDYVLFCCMNNLFWELTYPVPFGTWDPRWDVGYVIVPWRVLFHSKKLPPNRTCIKTTPIRNYSALIKEI